MKLCKALAFSELSKEACNSCTNQFYVKELNNNTGFVTITFYLYQSAL